MTKHAAGITVCIMLLTILGFCGFVLAEENAANLQIVELKGTASIKKAGADSWIPAAISMGIGLGDSIRTQDNSYVDFGFGGSEGKGRLVRVSKNSDVVAECSASEDKFISNIGKIIIWNNEPGKARDVRRLEIRTPNAVVGSEKEIMSCVVEYKDSSKNTLCAFNATEGYLISLYTAKYQGLGKGNNYAVIDDKNIKIRIDVISDVFYKDLLEITKGADVLEMLKVKSINEIALLDSMAKTEDKSLDEEKLLKIEKGGGKVLQLQKALKEAQVSH